MSRKPGKGVKKYEGRALVRRGMLGVLLGFGVLALFGLAPGGAAAQQPLCGDAPCPPDREAPSSSASGPASANGTVTISFAAEDPEGTPYSTTTGLFQVELWVKAPGEPVYRRVDYRQPGGESTFNGPSTESGVFTYVAQNGSGTYSFYTRAIDRAGNYEDAPADPDVVTEVEHSPAEAWVDGGTLHFRAAEGQRNVAAVYPETMVWGSPCIQVCIIFGWPVTPVYDAVDALPVGLAILDWGNSINAGAGCAPTLVSPGTWSEILFHPEWPLGQHKVSCPYTTPIDRIEADLGDGDDTLSVSAIDQDSAVDGGSGSDNLTGGRKDDVLDGGEGDDELHMWRGADVLRGGPGTDEAWVFGHADLEGDADDGDPGEGVRIEPDIEDLWAGGDDNTLEGNEAANGLYGNEGDDVIVGNGGHDVLHGDAGDDVIRSRDGVIDEVFCGSGLDVVTADVDDVLDGECEQVDQSTPPPNDDFADADDLGSAAPVSVTGTNVNATKEAGEPNHAADPGGASVWYRWTAPSSGEYAIDACASDFDTLVAVYTGSAVDSLSTIAANDQSCGDQSRVAFTATQGTTYRIAVDGYSNGGQWPAAAGEVALSLSSVTRPANDDFADASVLTGSTLTAEGTNVAASKEEGEPDHADDPGGASVWWSWTAPASGDVTIDTCASDFDTLLGVYTGSQVGGLTEVASNDEAGLFECESQSEVSFPATAGTTYLIAVDGWSQGSAQAPAQGEISLNIAGLPGDVPPTAVDDSAIVAEDSGANAIDVLANDTDPDDGPMTIESKTDGAHGTVAITGDGAGLTYQPVAGYCGPDSFTYALNGGSTATVSITVTCAADVPPTAVDDSTSVAEDSGANAINVLANDTDPDGGPKSIQAKTDGGHGTVVITGSGSGLTYRPAANYCGPDSFTYTLNGGSVATVSVTITCVDDLPTAVNDSATVAQDSGASAIDVLANDTDPDGGLKSIQTTTNGTNGAVAITAGGSGLSYEPAAGYCGSDSFTYTLNGGSSTSVSITITCYDDPPLAVDDSATVDEDSGSTSINVLANDTDVDGGLKKITSKTNGAHGTVTISSSGSSVFYRPTANYCGPDSFNYTLNGGSTATVSITVTCVAEADSVSPKVSRYTPSISLPIVSPATKVLVDFSEPMNEESAQSAFSLRRQSDGASVNGTFSWSLGNKMVFDPVADLSYATTYVAKVGTTAADINGNTLVSEVSWTFTTKSLPPSKKGKKKCKRKKGKKCKKRKRPG